MTPPQFSLRAEVEAKSLLGYRVALLYVNNVMAQLEQTPGEKSPLMEARLVRAEVLQKIGDVSGSRIELDRIDVTRLTPLSCQGYLLIRAKLRTQAGDVRRGDVALWSLGDKLGDFSATEITKTYLWRQAFTQGLLGEARRATRLADEHRDSVVRGGFHDANNVIYARLVPDLATGRMIHHTWRTCLDDVRAAGRLYILSDVDLAGRFGNRGKSLCQALLAEAFVLWTMESRLAAYRTGFTVALLLRYWGLGAQSEGVGEMLNTLEGTAVELVSAIRFVMDQDDQEPVATALTRRGASPSACAAFTEATEIAIEVLMAGGLERIYELLDEWS